MKSLPNVTLISYDNSASPGKTLRALQYSSREIQFAEVILVCARIPQGTNGTKIISVREKEYRAAMIWEVAGVRDHVKTDYALCIHHDGYVINPQAWQDDWLKYDFIGAPWPGGPDPKHPGKAEFPNGRVGNTGFCLKSKAFMQATWEIRDLFLHASAIDKYGQRYAGDTFYCQHQKPALEQRGMIYAPVEVAAAFSWESNIEEVPGDRPGAFGFHNFNLENKQIPRA